MPALILQLAILLRALPIHASTIPINLKTAEPKARWSVLALSLALGSPFLALFAVKCIYINRRRNRANQRGSGGNLQSGWSDNLSSGSSAARLKKCDGKSGFFIGLLGSPAWETRYSADISKVSGHLSLTHSNSVSSRSKSARQVSSSSIHSKYDAAYYLSGSPPILDGKIHASEAIKAFHELAFPSPALTVNRSPLISDWEQAHLFAGLSPHSESIRLLPSTPAISKGIGGAAGVAFPALSAATFKSRKTNAYSRDLTPRSLEVEAMLSGKSPLCPSRIVLTWTPESRGSSESLQAVTIVPEAVHLPLPHVDDNQLAAQETSDPTTVTPARIPNTDHLTPGYPLETSPPAMQVEPSVITEPRPVKKVRPRTNVSVPARSRQSPKLGPSPLRTMLLCSDSDTYQSKDPLLATNRHGQTSVPPPYVFCNSPKGIDPPQNTDAAGDPLSIGNLPRWKKQSDGDSLLDLMSELVQETSAWDPSLFFDDNFKALIAHAKPSSPPITPTKQRMKQRRQSWRASRFGKLQHVFATLEDIPEVDVTEMMPLDTDDGFLHSFWSDEDEDFQPLIGIAY